MNTFEAYQILSSFVRSTYGFYNEDKSKVSRLLEVSEVEEALKNIKYQLKTVRDKTFYLAKLQYNSKVVIFYSSPNDFEGKRVIAVFEDVSNNELGEYQNLPGSIPNYYTGDDPNIKYPCTMGDDPHVKYPCTMGEEPNKDLLYKIKSQPNNVTK